VNEPGSGDECCSERAFDSAFRRQDERRAPAETKPVRSLSYALGMFIAVMIGTALGGSLAEQFGRRRVLPIVVVATVLLGLAIGYGLEGEFRAIDASTHVGGM
jgi:nitrate/nitrite transporter NarK